MRSVHNHDDEPASKVVVSSWSASEEEENGSTRSRSTLRQQQQQHPQPDESNNNDKEEDSFSVETLRDELERWKLSLHHFDSISHDSSTARGNHRNNDDTATTTNTTTTAATNSRRRRTSPAKYNDHYLCAERHEDETEERVSPPSAFLHDLDTTESDDCATNDDNDGSQTRDRWRRRWDWSSHPQEDAEEDDLFVVVASDEPAVMDDQHKPRTDSRRRRYESTNHDYNNYRTPDTSFISNTEKTTSSEQEQPQATSTPGPPPPVETPARPAPPRRSGLDHHYYHDEDGDNDRNGTRTDRRFRQEPELDLDRRNQTKNNGRVRNTTACSDASAVREDAPSPDDEYIVDHGSIGEEEEENDGWQQRVLTAALHRQEDYIQALELENEQLRNNLQQQSRRRRQGIDVSDEDNLAASPWFTSPGTRFVAELATVMPLPEEYYGPLSRIMDKYYNDDRRPVAPQEKNYPSHPWWRR